VVLAARGLACGAEGRRKVQLTLVSSRDPAGEAFGAKVSPWTEGHCGGLRFGHSGLRCSFPLGAGRGAPSVAADVRFADSAKLRVRLLASAVPSQNSVLKAAAKFLPTSLTDGVSTELDEATAEVEGEALIPLTNLLSGRHGFAADRALGGWVPLQRAGGDALSDEIPLSLWMQTYVVPDHSESLQRLRAHLEEELARAPPLPAPSASEGSRSQQLAPQLRPGQALQAVWSPPTSDVPKRATVQTQCPGGVHPRGRPWARAALVLWQQQCRTSLTSPSTMLLSSQQSQRLAAHQLTGPVALGPAACHG